MPEPLRVGVVGLGSRGLHLSNLADNCEEVALVAVADICGEMLDITHDLFPAAELYQSGESLAQEADVEAIIVATGDRFHAGNAREALENGKHLLVEKPLAQSFDDITEIARRQKQTGLTVGTFLNMRHNGLWSRAKEILDSGRIGKILAGSMVDCVGRDEHQFFARDRTRSRERVLSLVLQKGVHSLDLLNWLMGASPRRVSATGGLLFFGGDEPADKHCPDCPDKDTCPHAYDPSFSPLPWLDIDLYTGEDFCVYSKACDVEDVTFINIDYTTGVVANYSEVHFAPYYGAHLTLYGEKAQLDVVANHDTGEVGIKITERYTRDQYREHPTDDFGHGQADIELLADFARAARTGHQPRSDLRAGFESAAVAIGAYHSISTGTFVDLPLLDKV